MGCIYAITCSDKYYIGSTKNFHKRMAEHKGLLEKGTHKNAYMQRVFDKYGGFEYKILESVEDDKLVDREQVHIDRHYDDVKCMNASPHAHRAYNPWTDESRKKMSESCKGRTLTEETKKKISDTKKGKPSPNHRAVKFIWNDKEYEFYAMSHFLKEFGDSSRCIYRRLTKNAGKWITLYRVNESSKHPFSNGDKLFLSWK